MNDRSGWTPTRRAALAGAAAIAGSSPLFNGSALAIASTRPNIVWIVSEDNNPYIGAYGDKLARTANIDRLAREGILYRNAYSNAPVCAPSRFGILTGVLPESCSPAQHMRANAKAAGLLPTYPELLRKAGYYVTNNVKTDYNCNIDPASIWNENSAKAHWKNRPAGQPFMAVFNLMTTHESQNFKPTLGAVKPGDVRVPAYMPDTPGVRQDIASYYNRMEIMDGQVGKLLAELDAAGLSDDTIVFYYSDNGGIQIRSKRFCFDEGLRCALIARVPAKWQHLSPVKTGGRVSAPVSFIDLAPTVLSLAGVPIPLTMQGKALLGRDAGKPGRFAFGMRNRMDERYDFVRTVTDGRFRYIRNYLPQIPAGQNVAFAWLARGYQDLDRLRLDGKLNSVQSRFFEERDFEEFYDLEHDPDEISNLAASPKHRARLNDMRRALDAHMLRINDNGFIPEGSVHEGYVASRTKGAYPLRRVMALAQAAARRDPRKLGLLTAALHDPNEVVRFWGATGLAILGSEAQPAHAPLRAALADRSPQVRVASAEALWRSGATDEALTALTSLLGGEFSDPVRLQSLNVLTRMGSAAVPALPALKRLTDLPGEYIPRAAMYLVQIIEGTYDPYKPVFDLDGFLKKGGPGNPNNPFNQKN